MKARILMALLVILFSEVSIANTIKNIGSDEPDVAVGDRFLLNLEMNELQHMIDCKITVEWGDGEKQKIDLGKKSVYKKDADGREDWHVIQLPHVYKSLGTKRIRIESPFFNGCDLQKNAGAHSISVIQVEEKAAKEAVRKEEREQKRLRLEAELKAQREAIEAERKRFRLLKINGLGLGIPEKMPCNPKPMEFSYFWSKSADAIYYACQISTDTDEYEILFESDMKSIYSITRHQFLFSNGLSGDEVLRRAEAFYGAPQGRASSILVYGDGYFLDQNRSIKTKSEGVGMSIRSFFCLAEPKNSKPCNLRDNPLYVISYKLIDVQKSEIESKNASERLKQRTERSLNF